MCPDSAFAMDVSHIKKPQGKDVTCFIRDDPESIFNEIDMGYFQSVGKVTDWIPKDIPKSKIERLMKSALKRYDFAQPMLVPKAHLMFKTRAQKTVDRGFAQLSSANVILSDRLHVHILSTILEIPHITFDNNYGKISVYISAWGKCNNTWQAENIEQAKGIISELI